jgi:hypothetical protein
MAMYTYTTLARTIPRQHVLTQRPVVVARHVTSDKPSVSITLPLVGRGKIDETLGQTMNWLIQPNLPTPNSNGRIAVKTCVNEYINTEIETCGRNVVPRANATGNRERRREHGRVMLMVHAHAHELISAEALFWLEEIGIKGSK